MTTTGQEARWVRQAVMLAATAALCVPASWGLAMQRGGQAARPAPAPHYAAPARQQAQNRPRNNGQRSNTAQYPPQNQNRPQTAPLSPARSQGNIPQNYGTQRPVAPAYVGPRPGYPNASYGNQGRQGYAYPGSAPKGHLGDWLNQHRGEPVQAQERTLRNDPSFNRLPQGDQQRLLQQLHRVNQMPEEQRQRLLARNEMLEHMTPQERMRLNMSGQRLATLGPERQALVKGAFRDLRAVPLDQRQMVLNSSRYQGVFSPEERGILSDFLRAEPYQPAR